MILKSESLTKETIIIQLQLVLQNPVFLLLTLGSSAFQFVLSGLGFWVRVIQLPDYLESYYHISSTTAVLYLGVMAIITGLSCTYAGSLLMNRQIKSYILLYSEQKISEVTLENFRTEHACLLISKLIIASFFVLIGCSLSGIFYVFYCLLGIAEVLMFLCISPSSITVMSCVPNHLRSLANGLNSLIVNVIGSATAPIVIGWMIDNIGMYWAIFFDCLCLFWVAAAWTLAWNSAVINI